jgi:hypothetical protein
MPPSVTIGLLVLGSVLLLVAIVGGRFKIFGAEISEPIPRGLRIVSGILSVVFLLVVMGSGGTRDGAEASSPSPAGDAAAGSTGTAADPATSAAPPTPDPPSATLKRIRSWIQTGKGSPSTPGLALGTLDITFPDGKYRVKIPDQYEHGAQFPALVCTLTFDESGDPGALSDCNFFETAAAFSSESGTPIENITLACDNTGPHAECSGKYATGDTSRRVVLRGP